MLRSPRWIEAVFGIDPDAGSGTLEWLIVGVFTLTATVAAVRDAGVARRLRAVTG